MIKRKHIDNDELERCVMKQLESKFKTCMLKEGECDTNGWKKKERR